MAVAVVDFDVLLEEKAFAMSHFWEREARWEDGRRRARSEGEVAYFCSKMDASCRVKRITHEYTSLISLFHISMEGTPGRQRVKGTNLDDALMNPHPRVCHL